MFLVTTGNNKFLAILIYTHQNYRLTLSDYLFAVFNSMSSILIVVLTRGP